VWSPNNAQTWVLRQPSTNAAYQKFELILYQLNEVKKSKKKVKLAPEAITCDVVPGKSTIIGDEHKLTDCVG
jgi:hypothetical protein